MSRLIRKFFRESSPWRVCVSVCGRRFSHLLGSFRCRKNRESYEPTEVLVAPVLIVAEGHAVVASHADRYTQYFGHFHAEFHHPEGRPTYQRQRDVRRDIIRQERGRLSTTNHVFYCGESAYYVSDVKTQQHSNTATHLTLFELIACFLSYYYLLSRGWSSKHPFRFIRLFEILGG